jgi:hypothetical protein
MSLTNQFPKITNQKEYNRLGYPLLCVNYENKQTISFSCIQNLVLVIPALQLQYDSPSGYVSRIYVWSGESNYLTKTFSKITTKERERR